MEDIKDGKKSEKPKDVFAALLASGCYGVAGYCVKPPAI
jgi:hypothetical protein